MKFEFTESSLSTMNMFEHHRLELTKKNAPLADRMRPRTLGEFVGQKHIIGQGRLLRRAIQIDQLSSLIFYGPPGSGKTTLARIIANTTKAHFLSINAVLAGVADIREAIATAQHMLSHFSKRTILFIDEVHRFNKAQQDALLPHVENGTIILIGATTENPYFEVNKALVSRSRIFQLQPLDNEELKQVARQALSDPERGYGNRAVTIADDALEHLAQVANGDSRAVLNALELAVETTAADSNGTIVLSRDVIAESIQRRAVLYDRDGDAHYDTVSAFIKSLRGSDPDAALYWMAKMLYAGENPRFIFRRMLILASEDIGLADPMALQVVTAAASAFEYVGLPEGRFHLSQAALYCATAAKSNSTLSFFDALDTVSKENKDDVPNHLKDASRDKEGFGHGKDYQYPHSFRDHWVIQHYLPEHLSGKLFYQPSDQGYEGKILKDVSRRREAQLEAAMESETENGHSDLQTQWYRRSMSKQAEQIAFVRDTIVEYAKLERTSLVLDVHGRSGLLALEASRKASEGTVWVAAFDQASFSTITKMT
ncbi:MAG: AAA family ATPase, partial [Chitinivibrionales bacterium]|nr:AAA family ATPase [Chitinivibrionales bacterium]